jgi:hypothetical protein
MMVMVALAFGVVALLPVLVVMVVALEVGAGRKNSGEIGLDRCLPVAGNAADYFDAGFGKSRHRATADPSADEKVDLVLAEQPGKRAVPDASRRDDLGRDDLAVRNFAYQELRRMAEVLEHLSVFGTYCYFHC